jgi:hypothetical protein
MDDTDECSLAAVEDDVAEEILTGILDTDFFRCVKGGDGEGSVLCFINDV